MQWGHPALFFASLFVLVGGAVETGHLVIDLTDEFNDQLSLCPRLELLFKSNLKHMSLLIQLARASKLSTNSL
jgi:hypothetical protein